MLKWFASDSVGKDFRREKTVIRKL